MKTFFLISLYFVPFVTKQNRAVVNFNISKPCLDSTICAALGLYPITKVLKAEHQDLEKLPTLIQVMIYVTFILRILQELRQGMSTEHNVAFREILLSIRSLKRHYETCEIGANEVYIQSTKLLQKSIHKNFAVLFCHALFFFITRISDHYCSHFNKRKLSAFTKIPTIAIISVSFKTLSTHNNENPSQLNCAHRHTYNILKQIWMSTCHPKRYRKRV